MIILVITVSLCDASGSNRLRIDRNMAEQRLKGIFEDVTSGYKKPAGQTQLVGIIKLYSRG